MATVGWSTFAGEIADFGERAAVVAAHHDADGVDVGVGIGREEVSEFVVRDADVAVADGDDIFVGEIVVESRHGPVQAAVVAVCADESEAFGTVDERRRIDDAVVVGVDIIQRAGAEIVVAGADEQVARVGRVDRDRGLILVFEEPVTFTLGPAVICTGVWIAYRVRDSSVSV